MTQGLLPLSYLSTLKQNTPLQTVSGALSTERCNRSFHINPSAAYQHKCACHEKIRTGKSLLVTKKKKKGNVRASQTQSHLTSDRNGHQGV